MKNIRKSYSEETTKFSLASEMSWKKSLCGFTSIFNLEPPKLNQSNWKRKHNKTYWRQKKKRYKKISSKLKIENLSRSTKTYLKTNFCERPEMKETNRTHWCQSYSLPYNLLVDLSKILDVPDKKTLFQKRAFWWIAKRGLTVIFNNFGLNVKSRK